MDRDKKKYRKLKRTLKRAGSKHRRRDQKQQLRESPADAPFAEDNFGRYSSAAMNGLDKDSTRRRVPDEEE